MIAILAAVAYAELWAILILAGCVRHERKMRAILEEGYQMERRFSDFWREEAFAAHGMDPSLAEPEEPS